MTRDRRDIREKTRAVLLAAIMIVSVFGGTMAFAGSAAATASDLSVDDGAPAAPDGSVNVSAQIDEAGNETSFILEDADGATTSTITVTDGGSDDLDGSENGEVTASIDLAGAFGGSNPVTGHVTVYASEGGAVTTNDAEETATFLVDGDAPTFGDETPEDGSAISTSDDIVVPIEDANTSVDFITATVTNGSEEVTFEINPETADEDGVSFSGNELTISPGKGGVPSIGDGTYTVDLVARDEVGNENTNIFTFTIDSDDPTVTFDSPASGDITSNENETIEVSLSPGNDDRTLNDSTAELTIEAADDYEETLDNSFGGYTNSSNTFLIDADDDIPPLPDGEVKLTASVEDEIGNDVTESLTFEVDKSDVVIEDLNLTDHDINNSDTGSQEAVISFDEPVSSVTISVNTGNGQYTVTETRTKTDNSEQVRVPLNLDETADVENDSAVVNVTDAKDFADDGTGTDANGLAFSANTTFAIDTDGPTITVEDDLSNVDNIDEPISGYVNFTSLVTDRSDVSEISYAIDVGTSSEARVPLSAFPATAENLPTQNFPDGEHALYVSVEDSAGNSADATVPFTLENGRPVEIEQTYLPGLVTPVEQGTDNVTVSEIFTPDVDDPEDVTYTVAGHERDASYTIEAEENRGQTLFVNATYEGDTLPVLIEFAPLVGAEESVSGHQIDIGLDTSTQNINDLTVTLEDTDNHLAETERTIPGDHFDQYSDSGIYTTTVGNLDDGEYTVTVTDDSGEDVTSDVIGDAPDNVGKNATVDHHDPSADTAYVTGSDGAATFVRVEFSEHITLDDSSTTTFRGESSAVADVTDNGDGTLDVVLRGEVQTADAPLLNVSDVTETTGDGSTTDTSTEVATASFDLSGDQLNVISIPAETGRVDISESDFDDHAINTISAYDADTGEFVQYSPGAEENGLTTLEGGVGYVVNADEDITVEINAENAPVANDRTQQSVEAGWNLVGHYQEGQQPVGQALTPLGDQVYQIEDGYTGSQLTNDAALNPKQGYWLFTNEGGLHVPVNYGGPTSEKPDVFVPSGESFVDPTEPTNTGKVTITVAVDTDAAVQTVRADAFALGIENAELSSAGGPDVQGATSYTGTFDVNYQAGYDGAERSIFVSAITTDGNIGSDSVNVDPVDRSGSVSITDANFSDLTEGDTANVTVETSYNAGGFEDARLSIKNSDGVEVGNETDPATDGSQDVNVTLSSLDDGETITAELIDAGEASDYVVADDTADVSGLDQLAYVENSPSTILGTGSTAIEDALAKSESTGSTVYLESGSYAGTDISDTVTIQGAPGANPVVDSNLGTAQDARTFNVNAGDVHIRDLTINGNNVSNGGGLTGVTIPTSEDGVVIEDTIIKNLQTAVQTSSGSGSATIQDNTMENVVVGVSTNNDPDTVTGNSIEVASNGEGLGLNADENTVEDNSITVASGYTSEDLNSNYAYGTERDGRAITLYGGTPAAADTVPTSNTYTLGPSDATEIVDNIAPSISGQSASAGSNSGTLDISVDGEADEGGTVYYVVVDGDDNDTPTTSEVKSGSGAGSETVYASGNSSVAAGASFSQDDVETGQAGTDLDVYFVQFDDAGNPSSVVRADGSAGGS